MSQYSPHWSPGMFIVASVEVDEHGLMYQYNALGYDKYGFDRRGVDVAGYTAQQYINDPELYMHQFDIWDKTTPIPGL